MTITLYLAGLLSAIVVGPSWTTLLWAGSLLTSFCWLMERKWTERTIETGGI